MARYMRTDLAAGHSRLRPPTVVLIADVNRPIQGRLFPSGQTTEIVRRRYVKPRLGPPRVVTIPAPFVQLPLSINLAQHNAVWRRNNQRMVLARVFPPELVDVTAQTKYLRVRLARNKPRPTTRRLSPPTVLRSPGVFVGPAVTLAPSPKQARFVQARVFPPETVDATPQVFSVQTWLVPSHRLSRRARWLLRQPADTVGLEDQGHVDVTLAPSPRQARKPHSALRPPTVIDLRPQVYTVAVSLAYSRRGRPRSRLAAPAVAPPVPVVFFGPQTTLAQIRPRPVIGRVFPPEVVALTERVAALVAVHLALRTRVEQRQPRSFVVRPIVVFASPAARGGIGIQLVRIRPSAVRSLLGRPATVSAPTVVYYGPSVHLVRRRPVAVRYLLRRPTVVRLAVEIYGPATALARNKPRRTTTLLRKPVVVRGAVELFGPTVTLTKARPRPTITKLRPPTVVEQRVYGGPAVTLAYSRRGQTIGRVFPPETVDVTPQTFYVNASLAYSRRGRARSRLAPVVFAAPPVVVYYGPTVTRARTPLRYLLARTHLLAPATIIEVAALGEIGVQLARIRPPATRSRLRPPVAVTPAAVTYRLHVTLAPQRRARTRWLLRKPAVVDLRPQTYYLSVTLVRNKPQRTLAVLVPPVTTEALPRAERKIRVVLTYSRRGRPKSALRKPTVIDLRPQTRFLRVKLAYSRRGRPRSRLFLPTVVLQRPFRPLLVHLTYSVRKPGRAVLRKPTRVQQFVARPIQIATVRIRRPKFTSRLLPPAVVRVPENRRTRVTLVRNQPKPTVTLLGAPTVVAYAPVETTVAATLAYPLRGRPRSRLAVPAIIGAGIYFRPIQTHLVRITHPPVLYLLLPPAVVNTFIPPAGDVCGFDVAASFVCGDDDASVNIQGGDGAGSSAQGSDTTGSRITGGDNAVGEVCGTDEQAT